MLDKSQNNLLIQFIIGDTSLSEIDAEDFIFLPLTIFDGKTNYMDGQKYFDEVCQFLHDEYGFIWVSP